MKTEAIADWLKKVRRRNGLTQADLAARIGVAQPTISNWESGKGEPDNSQKRQLSSILGANPTATASAENEGFTGPSIVGTWLLRARQKKGWTPAELAAAAGVSQPTIYNIESARALNPHPRTIEALEKALGLPFDASARQDLKEESEIEGLGELKNFDPHSMETWPNDPGVYVFYDISDRPIYIGQAKNIAERIGQHKLHAFWFRHPVVAEGDGRGAYIAIKDPKMRRQVEKILIRFLKTNAVLNKQGVEREDEE